MGQLYQLLMTQHWLINYSYLPSPLQHWLINYSYLPSPLQHWLINYSYLPSPLGIYINFKKETKL